jgi:hypothetical protein
LKLGSSDIFRCSETVDLLSMGTEVSAEVGV